MTSWARIRSLPMLMGVLFGLTLCARWFTGMAVSADSALLLGEANSFTQFPNLASSSAISITTNGILPQIITVEQGTQVTWHNTTNQALTLRSGVPMAIYLPLVQRSSSPAANAAEQEPIALSAQVNEEQFGATLAAGAFYTYTFDQVGLFPYYVVENPSFTGQVKVEAAIITPTPATSTSTATSTATPSPTGTPSPTATSTATPTATEVVGSLPPDPATVAPTLDASIITDFSVANAFLYQGDNPIQRGVLSATIESRRIGVLRGRVLTRAGAPLPGVVITVLHHPEYGSTLSRLDGVFDLVVNGGGWLTINYAKSNYLPAQRQVNPPWRDYTWLPDVVMIQPDPNVTAIDLAANLPIQVARGSVISDGRGLRQATLLFTQGTQAEMVFANGMTQTLTSLHVRATEYTVGESGPDAMPAMLPPNSGYTYAAEFSVDEAQAAGATEVRFDRPVLVYLENFIGFPAGVVVPTGYYDRDKAQWIGSPDGRVVKVVGIVDGQASLDIDGDEVTDPTAELGKLEITDVELQQLAQLYQVGQSLWRVPLNHFSPKDMNWPLGPPPDAVYPHVPIPQHNEDNLPGKPDPCKESGSVIGCFNRSLGEDIDIAGTYVRLHYQSDRVRGRQSNSRLLIPVTAPVISSQLLYARLDIVVANSSWYLDFIAPKSNFTYLLDWDGRDVFGRMTQGFQPIHTALEYRYSWTYYATRAQILQAFTVAPAFGRSPGEVSGTGVHYVRSDSFEEPLLVRTTWQSSLSFDENLGVGNWNAAGQGFGGWTLDIHHVYDPNSGIIYFGDGTQSGGKSVNQPIKTVAGRREGGVCDGIPAFEVEMIGNVVVAADGTYFFASDSRICHVGIDGIATTFAGTGDSGFSGDHGPATQAQLSSQLDIALAADGSLYIADNGNNRVRHVANDGIITTVAGSGDFGDGGDGGLALAAQLAIERIAVSFDGSIYVVGNHRIRHIAPDGYITTMAGTGVAGYNGDGGLATQARLNDPMGMAVDAHGLIYIADSGNQRIRRVAPSGTITTVAGSGVAGFAGDGLPALQTQFNVPRAVAVGGDGSLYIADTRNHRVRQIMPNGMARTVAGIGVAGDDEGDGPATLARLTSPDSIALSPDSTLYIADSKHIRQIGISSADFATNRVIPSPDGSQLFEFDVQGRHQRTLNALTGAVRYQFAYDAQGHLIEVRDGDGNVTTIVRTATGSPSTIIGPDGHSTSLTLDANGYLATVTNPAGETTHFGYSAGGLLVSLRDPANNIHNFEYDALGRLVRDSDPLGGSKTLSSFKAGDVQTVTVSTALTRSTIYQLTTLPNGAQERVITYSDGQQERTLNNINHTQHQSRPDGSQIDVVLGGDPRWGLAVPVETTTVITLPSGITASSTLQRTVGLQQENDPFSVGEFSDVVTVNGQVYSSIYSVDSHTLIDTSPSGQQYTMVLDDQGRPLQRQSANLAPMSYSYDARGRVTAVTQGTSSNARTIHFAYDASGNLASLRDPLDRTVSFAYDALGRVVRQTLPDGNQVALTYTASGKVASVTPPGKPAHTFTYDALGQKVSYTPPAVNPGSQATNFTYNLDRQLTGIQRADGRTIQKSYDSAGRLARIEADSRVIDYRYNNSNGKVATLSTSDGSTLTLTYDGFLLTGSAWSGPVVGAVDQLLGDGFKTTQIKVNNSTPIEYAYDVDGFLLQAGALTLARNPINGLVTGSTLANVSDAWSYNEFVEPLRYSAKYANNTLYDVQIERDLIGRIQQKRETILGTTTTYNYTYDLLGRLLTVQGDAATVESYSYDAHGNRLNASNSAGAAAATFDAQDRLVTYGATTYTFNAAGELASGTAAGQITTYEHDVYGNLTSVRLPNGTQIDYLLDGRNRRIGRKVNGLLVQGFLYQDRLRPAAEVDRNNAVVSRFVYASNVNVPDFMLKAGATYRLIQDPLGSVRLVVNVATGQVAQRLDYDAFGRILLDSNPGFQPFAYAGGLYDPLTGLVHFGRRDYSAEEGRWIEKDPVGFVGGDTNLYAYVENDPINRRDPLGYLSIEGSVYALFGVGGKLSITSEGVSFCWEVGLGIGAGAALDPFEGLERTSTSLVLEASAKAFALSAGLKTELDDCGKLTTEGKGCIAFICGKEKWDPLTNEVEHSAEATDDIFDAAKEGIKNLAKSAGAKVEAKAAAKFCVGK